MTSFKPLTNRASSKAHGDDTTLTRFHFAKDDPAKVRSKRRQPRLPGYENAFVREGRPKFMRSVKKPEDLAHLLVSGHSNAKIGRDVRVGKLKGFHIYTLSLPERLTCPTSCKHWEDCYGNNMPFAKRIDPSSKTFLPRLSQEIDELMRKHRGKVLIRLHALGDFYSTRYVQFWSDQLRKHPTLHLFGYTARKRGTEIGDAVFVATMAWDRRFMVRVSDGGEPEMCTVSIGGRDDAPAGSVICPEQLGVEHKRINPKTGAPYAMLCATCGICWSTPTNVAFMEH